LSSWRSLDVHMHVCIHRVFRKQQVPFCNEFMPSFEQMDLNPLDAVAAYRCVAQGMAPEARTAWQLFTSSTDAPLSLATANPAAPGPPVLCLPRQGVTEVALSLLAVQ
jgi:hypothetical protein